MNKVILMGRLTRDPEVRYGGQDNQMAVARFSLAVDRKYQKKGEERQADFFNCTAFGKLAELIERTCRKGMKLLITGSLQNDNYTNQHGERVYSVGVIVQEMEYAESKAAGGNCAGATKTESPDGFMDVSQYGDDEVPFG